MAKRQQKIKDGKTTEHHYDELCRVQDPKNKKKFVFGKLISVTAEDIATVLTESGATIQVDKSYVRVRGAGGWDG